jgi:hypothetical protein
MFQDWTAIFFTTLQTIGVGMVKVLPQILLAGLLVILGAVVGSGISRLIARGVSAIKIDKVLETAGVTKLFSRSGYTLNVGALLGGLVQWFIILIFVVAAFDVLGLDQVNMFLREVVLSYLPRVVVAVLILISAAIVAEFVHTMVVGASRAADVRSHYLLGTGARFAIWAFAILAALNELHVATAFIQTLFTGIVVALSLALGLSFGLGGRDAAARYIEHLSSELKERKEGE